MKAIISIPVHERPDVILDQIRNINHYFPEADIVLHVSAGYFDKYELGPLTGLNGVYINPVHMETGWGNIFLTHVRNFAYIESLGIDYDYFILHSSNDMYVRHGVGEYIRMYDAGFCLHYLPQKHTYWWPCTCAWEDPGLEACMEKIGQTRRVATQAEGSFYRREIMRRVMDTIMECEDDGTVAPDNGRYGTREEFYFSTIAECMIPRERIGRPFVFSEVHRFDRKLWRDFQRMDRQYMRWGRFLLPGRAYNKLKSIYNDYSFSRGAYLTKPETVDRIRRLDEKYVEENRFLYDGVSKFELYRDASSLYAVKRVKREYNDPLRMYIRGITEQEQA